MVRRSSVYAASTPIPGVVAIGILALTLLAQSGSSAPSSHHRPSLEAPTTPTTKGNLNPIPKSQGRSPTYLQDQLQILYDHLDQQAAGYPGTHGGHHYSSSSALSFQATVHPLNRKRSEENSEFSRRERERLGHAAAKMVEGGGDRAKRQVQTGQYQGNQFAPLALAPVNAEDSSGDAEIASVPAGGRIGAAVSTQEPTASAATANPVSTASASQQTQTQSQSSSDSRPTSSPPPTQSQSSSTKTEAVSSSSSKSPTSTKAPEDQDEDNAPSILNSKNHLFPLMVTGVVAAGLFAIILLISFGRACAHWRMKSSSGKTDENGNLTGGVAGGRTGKSLRRAMTGRKIGSFQRRTREGSVLIEVGDEVFAVPPHVAEEYHRRQKQALNPSANSSVLGRAADTRGLDLQSWRLASAKPPAEGPRRSLSARLMDSLRALRNGADGDDCDDEKTCYSFDSEKQMKGQMRQSNPNAFMPVITKGNGGWNIKSSDEYSQDDHQNQSFPRPRETPQLGRPYLPPTPKVKTPMMLSHERVQLSDGPVTPNVPGGFPGEGRTLKETRKEDIRKVNRPNSRRNGHHPNVSGGSYRHKKSEKPTSSNAFNRTRSMAVPKSKITSTSTSSPALYTARGQSPPSPKAALQPEKPRPTATNDGEGRRTPERFRGREGRANGKVARVPTFRPTLPMPPHLSPIQSSPKDYQ